MTYRDLGNMSFKQLHALATATPVGGHEAVEALQELGHGGRAKLADLVIAALARTDGADDGPRGARLKGSLIHEVLLHRDSEPRVAFAFFQLAAARIEVRVDAIAAFQSATRTYRVAPPLRSSQIKVVALALRDDWQGVSTVLCSHPGYRVHVWGQTRVVVEAGREMRVVTTVDASGARAYLWLPGRQPIPVPSDAIPLFVE